MSIQTIRFDKRPWRDSKGRNGYILTSGVEIMAQDAFVGRAHGCDGSVMLQPITSRGEVSEACRVSIARSHLPEVIAAFQAILDDDDLRRALDAAAEADAREAARLYEETGDERLRTVM